MKKFLFLLLPFFGFAQFNPIFFATKHKPANTFIGGVSSTIPDKTTLATKLGISSTRIINFTIIGSDIQCTIIGAYTPPGNMFLSDTSIKYFKDNDRLMQVLANGSFDGCTNLDILEIYGVKNVGGGGFAKIRNTKIVNLYFPEMTALNGNQSIINNNLLTSFDAPNMTSLTGGNNLSNNPNLSYINIPKVATQIGVSSGDNQTFLNCKIGCVINANIALQTSNSGSIDADLQYAITSRSAVVNWIP